MERVYNNVAEEPKTFDEFIEQDWGTKILRRIKRFDLRDCLNDPEELLQDIYVQLLKTDYIRRYDKTKNRSFEVYIYTFVDNFLKGKYKREHTKNGIGIVNKASLEYSMPENKDSFEKGVVYLENLNLFTTSDIEKVELESLFDRVREELSVYTASSSNVYEGVVFNRDPLTVFNLILSDHSVAEIATFFSTSSQFVYNLIKKIRESKSLQELRNFR